MLGEPIRNEIRGSREIFISSERSLAKGHGEKANDRSSVPLHRISFHFVCVSCGYIMDISPPLCVHCELIVEKYDHRNISQDFIKFFLRFRGTGVDLRVREINIQNIIIINIIIMDIVIRIGNLPCSQARGLSIPPQNKFS
jgi:hypothetical protein